MTMCRITVLRKSLNDDAVNPHISGSSRLCPVFLEGQTFDSAREQPEGFCAWAWNSISQYVNVIGESEPPRDTDVFMVENHSVVASCSDSSRPVFF